MKIILYLAIALLATSCQRQLTPEQISERDPPSALRQEIAEFILKDIAKPSMFKPIAKLIYGDYIIKTAKISSTIPNVYHRKSDLMKEYICVHLRGDGLFQHGVFAVYLTNDGKSMHPIMLDGVDTSKDFRTCGSNVSAWYDFQQMFGRKVVYGASE